MQKTFVEFSKTAILPPLILDYLNDDKSLREFYNYRPEINLFEKVIHQKQAEKINRKLLVEVLNEQYSSVFANEIKSDVLVKANIVSLLNENTFTVTTGHQLNIFTGPLFFIYKIISTINLSEKLAVKYPAYNFVPVYWMAAEDHDFEEINHIHLFGKKIVWSQNEKGACGRIATTSFKSSLDELKLIIGASPNGEFLLQLFENAYLKNKNLSEATRYLAHQLFSKYGLVIIDGDNKKLKNEFSDIMLDDLTKNSAFLLVNETIRKLESKYKIQVKPREINLFYLQENLRGRIEKNNSHYSIHDSTLKFSEKEILEQVISQSENFSPNVVLRPLYQEKILPNLAYVGGPGELTYWLEYKKMFDFYKTTFPVLMLRNSVLWIDNAIKSKMDKLHLKEVELFVAEDALIKKFITMNSAVSISLAEEISGLEKIFESINHKIDTTDHSLISSIQAEKQKCLQSFQNVEMKLIRAEKKKHETAISQIKNIKQKLFPENLFQERYDNFIPYYLKYGDGFIKTLKENLDIFDARLLICTEE